MTNQMKRTQVIDGWADEKRASDETRFRCDPIYPNAQNFGQRVDQGSRGRRQTSHSESKIMRNLKLTFISWSEKKGA